MANNIQQVKTAIEKNGGAAQAARALGISRARIYQILDKHGLKVIRVKERTVVKVVPKSTPRTPEEPVGKFSDMPR